MKPCCHRGKDATHPQDAKSRVFFNGVVTAIPRRPIARSGSGNRSSRLGAAIDPGASDAFSAVPTLAPATARLPGAHGFLEPASASFGAAVASAGRDVRILHNSVRDNAGHHGMVMADTNDSAIKGIRVSGNGGEGVILEGGKRNRITRNRLVRNDAGITLGPGSHNVIKRN